MAHKSNDKKINFLRTTNALWCTEILDWQEYMTCFESLMMLSNVFFKNENELEIDEFLTSVTQGFTTTEIFELRMNNEGTTNYPVFASICETYLDFSKMDYLTNSIAA